MKKNLTLGALIALGLFSAGAANADLLLTPGQSALIQVGVPTQVSCQSVTPVQPPSICGIDQGSNGTSVTMQNETAITYYRSEDALKKLKDLTDSGVCHQIRCRVKTGSNGASVILNGKPAITFYRAEDALDRLKQMHQDGLCGN